MIIKNTLNKILISAALLLSVSSAVQAAGEVGPFHYPLVQAQAPEGYAITANLFAGDSYVMEGWCIEQGYSAYSRMEMAFPTGWGDQQWLAQYVSGGTYYASRNVQEAPYVKKIWCIQ